MRWTRGRGALLLLLCLSFASFTAGCLDGLYRGADGAAGPGEGWRPANPEAADYLVHLDEGRLAPHPVAYQGPFAEAVLANIPVEATTDRLRVRDLLAAVRQRAQEADTAEGGVSVPGGDAVLLLVGASGTLATDQGTVRIEKANIFVRSSRDHLEMVAPMTVLTERNVRLTPTAAHMDYVGFPVHLPKAASLQDRAGWSAVPVEVRLQGPSGLAAVQVAWSDADPQLPDAERANGTLTLDGNQSFGVGAPALEFVPATIVVDEPIVPGAAATGYRTARPVGFLQIDTAKGKLQVRGEAFSPKPSVALHLVDWQTLTVDPQSAYLQLDASAIQMVEGTRPWFASDIDIDHPTRDPERLEVILRVPPGGTFRTMLGVREISNVGSAIDVRPAVGDNRDRVQVEFDPRWHDERLFVEDRLAVLDQAFGDLFWTPDGQVSIGPRETAFLPITFDLPAAMNETLVVEVVLHPRNAAVLHVDFVLIPDEDAASSDVAVRREPAPSLAWGLMAVAAALGRLRPSQRAGRR